MSYYDDHRVRAKDRKRLRMVGTQGVYEACDADGNELMLNVPTHYEVCPTCDGKGSHVNPSVDAHGISADEFYDDPDFAESYMSGHYDVTCYGCNGLRVVPVISRERLDEKTLQLIDEMEQCDRELAAERRAEMQMGC